MAIDHDQPDPRLVAELVARYEGAAARVRQRVLHPRGKSDSARQWNQARAAQVLAQVEGEVAGLKQQAAKWTGAALSRSVARGVAVADRQAAQAGIRPPSTALAGSFAVLDRGAVEVLARDTVGDLTKAADSMRRQADNALRRMAAAGVSNAEVNSILSGGVIEGQPVQAARELREALKKVHGRKVTITDKNGDPIEFDAGYYAKMVAVTKTREATSKARHARLAERGIDLVVVTGRISANFCTAYVDKVFSIAGGHRKYPPLSSLPGGGPPFHPNCSKSTAPFIEDLANPEEIAAGQPDPDTDKLLNVRNRNELQKRYQALQMRQQVQQRAATVRTDAGRRAQTTATDDPEYQSHLLKELGVETVRLGGDAQIGDMLVRGLQQVVSAGGTLPSEIVVDEFLFRDRRGHIDPHEIAKTNDSGRIAINPRWIGWHDGGARMKALGEARAFSSGHRLHVVFHEAAHVHAVATGAHHRQAIFVDLDDLAVAESVSVRATVNKDEFLAEVRAAKMAGRRFGSDVLDLYERLGGR